jgi:hypothetical protein
MCYFRQDLIKCLETIFDVEIFNLRIGEQSLACLFYKRIFKVESLLITIKTGTNLSLLAMKSSLS